MNMGSKLTIGFAAMLGLVVGLSLRSLISITGLGGALEVAVNSTAAKMDLSRAMEAGFQEMRVHAALTEISVINGTLVKRVSNHGSEMVCSECHSEDKVAENWKDFDRIAGRMKSDSAKLRALLVNDSERKSLDVVDAGLNTWRSRYGEYLALIRQQKFEEAHGIMLGEIYPLVENIGKTAEGLDEKQQQAMQVSRAGARQSVSRSFWQTSVMVGLCLIFGVGGLLLVRRVVQMLRLSAAEISEMTGQVSSASGQVSQASQTLAQSASEQAASLEETSASATQMSGMTRETVEVAKSAVQVSELVDRRTAEANQTLERMTSSMVDIEGSSRKISKVMGMIDEIAFQTNILALNAAVEAARAGEAGLGFGVVADEVRSLAQRCASATQETATLIEESIGSSRQGRQALDALAGSIRGITELSQQMNGLMGKVDSGNGEQSRAIESVSRALTQMEQTTQSVAACAEQNAAAGEQLSAQSEQLSGIAERLSLMVGRDQRA